MDVTRVPAGSAGRESRSHDPAHRYRRMRLVPARRTLLVAALLAALSGCTSRPPVLPDATPGSPGPTTLTDPWGQLAGRLAAPLPGARGQCFSVEPNSAALASPVDPGVYCYDEKGTLTAAALPLGTLTLASALAPAPPSVVLPGPVVPGTPLATAAPPSPSPSASR